MSFLNPLFLFALLTIAVPLLIYLLNIRKPKKVRFSTLAFFESLKSTSLKRIRIKRWLLLFIRCLAVAALAIAASRPFLPPEFGWTGNHEPKIIGILMDNSPSMERLDRNGPYIEQALELAGRVVDIAGNDDRILLNVTNGASLNLPVLSRQAATRRLQDIETVNSGNYLANRLEEMAGTLQESSEPNKLLYLITDAQATQFSEMQGPEDEPDENIHLQIIRLGEAETSNIGFETAGLEYGGRNGAGQLQLRTVVKNYGSQPVPNTFISFLVEGEMVTQQTFVMEPETTREFTFELPPAESQSVAAEVVLEGDELVFDNRQYLAVELPETKNILALSDPDTRSFNSYLQPLLEIAAEEMDRFNIVFETTDNLSVSELYSYDAVIMDGVEDIPDFIAQSVVEHVQAGAGFLFLPAAAGNINSYNRLMELSGAGRYSDVYGNYGSFEPIDRMETPEEGHPVLENIFDKSEDEEIRLNVPEIFYYYGIDTRRSGTSLPVLSTATGNPLLTETRAGNGRMIFSAIGSDPGWSNFPVKPFFAPLFFRTIDYLGRGEGAVLNTHTLGNPFRTVLEASADAIELQKDGETILPEIRQTFRGSEIIYQASEWEPGWLRIETGERSRLFSVNQHAMESQLASLTTTELEEFGRTWFANVKATGVAPENAEPADGMEMASFGREIWYWFVIIAIILLLLESLIARHYKAESIG